VDYYHHIEQQVPDQYKMTITADPFAYKVADEEDDYEKLALVVRQAVHLAAQGSLQAIPLFEKAMEQSANVGLKMDALLTCVRLHWLHNKDIAPFMTAADQLVDKADWDRRNKYKVYKAVQLLLKRDFEQASILLAETLSTFTSTELFSFHEFTQITVVVCILTKTRPELKKLNIQVDDKLFIDYQQSLYLCQYDAFFGHLASIEEYMQQHWLLSRHVRYYVKEMKLKSYQQVLTSYQSIHLHHLAKLFGVSVYYFEHELFKAIQSNRINAQIDKVNGMVKMAPRKGMYTEIMKVGDQLMNKIQALSRVIYM